MQCTLSFLAANQFVRGISIFCFERKEWKFRRFGNLGKTLTCCLLELNKNCVLFIFSVIFQDLTWKFLVSTQTANELLQWTMAGLSIYRLPWWSCTIYDINAFQCSIHFWRLKRFAHFVAKQWSDFQFY